MMFFCVEFDVSECSAGQPHLLLKEHVKGQDGEETEVRWHRPPVGVLSRTTNIMTIRKLTRRQRKQPQHDLRITEDLTT